MRGEKKTASRHEYVSATMSLLIATGGNVLWSSPSEDLNAESVVRMPDFLLEICNLGMMQ